MNGEGRLIVIEGLDGSGKATQTAALANWLTGRGRQVLPITFPDYESDSSAPVRMYLRGEVGGVDDVNAYAASTFYAVDRFISYQNRWKNPYQCGYTILADRYTTSNAAHQMSKLPHQEWEGYLEWLDDLEYRRMGLPRPDGVVYLDMAPAVSGTLLQQRYGGEGARDIHEGNGAYLERCRDAALYAAVQLGWRVIRCDDGAAPLPVAEVEKTIRAALLEAALV